MWQGRIGSSLGRVGSELKRATPLILTKLWRPGSERIALLRGPASLTRRLRFARDRLHPGAQ